ncbi:hypothetical protein F5144DRAFT_600325 [Chaetomium tenue]|uniref:Uncharacterized protein n=1 Tax=Chaetomium tenue TaxID=1854479 RepID=A0ACB7PKY3_9PEZI|nr:hypothetical protein F5144DRAFT_600325 [Chaetomium globosum]
MTTQPSPEIILYDLASTKNVCFSPVVWRIRLILNYKQIPYQTIFLEFPDIEPTLSALGLPPHPPDTTTNPPKPPKHAYTVPAIYHLPTSTYLMDSLPITHFLNTTYPTPPLSPPTPQTALLEAQLRAVAGPPTFRSVVPRELRILAPRAQEYFRRTREPGLGGLRVEDLLRGEEEAWEGAREGLEKVDGVVRELRERGGGRFVGGERPGVVDFLVAGGLRSMWTVEEGLLERYRGMEGILGVYEACLPWMERCT